jgi:hypothetical protein
MGSKCVLSMGKHLGKTSLKEGVLPWLCFVNKKPPKKIIFLDSPHLEEDEK